MKMIDLITEQILKQIESSEKNIAEIQRNEMAEIIGCVPSQINYCISSRFTPERGYIVESRRGGGGYIRITRVRMDRSSALMHLIHSVGGKIDEATARVILENCMHSGLIAEVVGNAMIGALSPAVTREIPAPIRDKIRAVILKQMLITQI